MESKPPPLPRSSILGRLIKMDTAVSLHLHTTVQPLLPRSLLKTLEISGDGRLFFPLTISLLLSPLSTTTTSTSSPLLFSLLADLLIGGLLDLLFVGLIKHLVRRPRPVYNKDMFLTFSVDHWSFPSGHSSRVCFVASFLCLSSALIGQAITQLRSSRFEFVDKFFNLVDFDDVTWHSDMEPNNVENDGGDCDWKPRVHMTFDTEQEAYNFYNAYGGRMGFSIRRGYVNKNKEGQITSRLFVCNKEGFRGIDKRDPLTKNPRQEVRTGCQARLIIKWDRNIHKFFVAKFSSSQYSFFNAIDVFGPWKLSSLA